jgi:chromosome segregation ATPase
MKASEIRKALQPFANFGPAILKAAEICDSAEAAEASLKDHEKKKETLLAEIADLEGKVKIQQQQISKLTRDAESIRPDSKRVQDLTAREQAVTVREQSVVAREEAVLAREQKAKNLSDHLAAFHDLNS